MSGFLLTLVLAVPSFGGEVEYELADGSAFTDVAGGFGGNGIRTEHPLEGTFTAIISQSRGGVFIAMKDFVFRSKLDPSFTIVGTGSMNVWSCALKWQSTRLRVSINDSFILPISSELSAFSPFPVIEDYFSTNFVIRALPEQGFRKQFFYRSDVNSDGSVDISDVVGLLLYQFVEPSEEPSCLDAADVNDSGTIDVSDAIALLRYLFLGSFVVPPPACFCGLDPTEDELDCDGQSACFRESFPDDGE